MVSCVQVALIAVVGVMLYKRRRNSAVVKGSWAAEAAVANVSHSCAKAMPAGLLNHSPDSAD